MSELARWGRGVIKDIDLSADGRWIAVAAGSGVYIHDAHDLNAEPRAFETTGNVTAVSISPTGDKIALIVHGDFVQVWQVEPLELLFVGEGREQVQFSPDGSVLGIFDRSLNFEILDSSNGSVLISHFLNYAAGFSFSPSGSRIAIWSNNGETIPVYDWREDRLVLEQKVVIHPQEDGEFQASLGDVVFITEDDLRLLVHEI